MDSDIGSLYTRIVNEVIERPDGLDIEEYTINRQRRLNQKTYVVDPAAAKRDMVNPVGASVPDDDGK